MARGLGLNKRIQERHNKREDLVDCVDVLAISLEEYISAHSTEVAPDSYAKLVDDYLRSCTSIPSKAASLCGVGLLDCAGFVTFKNGDLYVMEVVWRFYVMHNSLEWMSSVISRKRKLSYKDFDQKTIILSKKDYVYDEIPYKKFCDTGPARRSFAKFKENNLKFYVNEASELIREASATIRGKEANSQTSGYKHFLPDKLEIRDISIQQ